MKYGVLVFPGSNCDHDMVHVMGTVLGQRVEELWHKRDRLDDYDPATDTVLVPGGFSYGDYLRSGALARFSPVMAAVIAFAQAGGRVVGICNGFHHPRSGDVDTSALSSVSRYSVRLTDEG